MDNRLAPIIARHDDFIGGKVQIMMIYKSDLSIVSPVINKSYLISALSDYSAEKLVLELVGINDLDRNLPPFEARQLCPFSLGDRYCGYAGATSTCDKTYKNCQKLGNSSRYGGVLGEVKDK
ncbi:hypothetical protein [Psittacicella hinzii]|uniref:hypothetical protein n=1 Tax=Psittacicella hinzii TaxID=2028575 RepID=UPI0011C36DAE|nr:hypothetical protein [Psittacicella hinzii]